MTKHNSTVGVTGTQAPSDAPCKAHHLIACVQCTSGVQGMDGAQAAEKLREDTRQHGHCPSCHALHPQHHVNCTRGVIASDGSKP